jgi:hypothetical protein
MTREGVYLYDAFVYRIISGGFAASFPSAEMGVDSTRFRG